MSCGGTDTAYELAKKHGVKLAWGTDTLFDAEARPLDRARSWRR